MTDRSGASSVDAYIAEFPPEVQQVLQEMRNLIKAAAPDATEAISYAMPTFDLNGKHLVHFAAFKHHIGLYPTPTGVEAFKADLAPYKTSKGAVQFPLGQPLPTDLIRRIVAFRVAESMARKAAKAPARAAAPAADTPADDFPAGISQPARRALASAGYTRLDQLTQVTEKDLLQLHGMGPKALGQLKDALAARGKSFAQ
jgi:uncharacterized protein YdhG (YjbR/CyaY superfamily)